MPVCLWKGDKAMALLHVGASPVSFKDYAVHSHDCYEIILNAEGTGTAMIGGTEYPFSPGTIHIIPWGMPHNKRSEEGFRDLYLHTDTFLRMEEAVTEPIFLSDDASHTAEGLLSLLLSRYLLQSRGDAVTQTLFEALLQLIEELRREAELSASAPADPVVKELIRTITASYNNPEFQVTEALLATGYSKDHIRRRFQQCTGMSPTAYLRDVRLRYAKRLLGQRDTLHLPVHEIAAMCGYLDAAYFCRIFRRETGLSPMEYAEMEQ